MADENKYYLRQKEKIFTKRKKKKKKWKKRTIEQVW